MTCLRFFSLIFAGFCWLSSSFTIVCTAKGMYIECVRKVLKIQKKRMENSINNFKNYTYKEISARENMVSGGTVKLWQSYKTLCKSSWSPGAISVGTVLSLQSLGGYRDRAMRYVAENQILLGHKAIQAVFPEKFVILRCAIVCLSKMRKGLLLLTSFPRKQAKWRGSMLYF